MTKKERSKRYAEIYPFEELKNICLFSRRSYKTLNSVGLSAHKSYLV